MAAELRFIDLFAGAGGLSEGFIKAGFKPVAHVEYDVAACNTLKTRMAYHYLSEKGNESVYFSYLKGEIGRDVLYSSVPDNVLNSVINAKIGDENNRIFSSIDKLLNGQTVDIIIGGPPCQAYSVVGRAPLKHKENDERTTLYVQYGQFLKKYKPKVFVFENVPGILSAAGGQYFKSLQDLYKGMGYEVKAETHNSHEFGVAQKRERVIIIGWKKELNFKYPDLEKEGKKYFRDDIFSDLPKIKPGESKRVNKYSRETNNYLSDYKIRNGVDFVTQHVTRPHNEKDLNIYKMAIKKLESGERLKNDQIPDEMRTQKNLTDFLDRFKVVDRLPHTMIAHIAKDGHHFIHPDIKQLRSISVREAARIQSFPDDYFFEGIKENQYRSAAFRQIGNAVPPLMAEKIAGRIREMLIEKGKSFI